MAINPGSIDAGVGIGEIFVDKYRVDGILGHGGMGVVALCTHLALNEQVAIKMLRKDVLDDADAVERFMREAQAAVKLKSEYVARVTDVGRSRTNVPYMVMEYLEGHDLGELLDEHGKLTLSLAVELTLQACEALAEAHSIHIVHRDVKPTNLFVTWRPDGSVMVKVLDFGISKALAKTELALTQTQSLLGTPAYMSPEQMRSARNVDARTDIWSLGTVLYELLEGHRPFEAESFSEMCVKVAVDPPGAMTQTPAALQQVVMRCLEKAPDDRYASMADLARDLAPFAHDRHQADVLVERATRMLRLSGVQSIVRSPTSSGNSGPVRKPPSGEQLVETAPVRAAGSGTAIPLPAGDARSGSATAIPLPAAEVATGSGAAIPLSPAELTTAVAPPTAVALPARAEFRAGSGPAFSETLAVVRKPRRTALWIATALIAAAALGAAISLARSPSDPPAASRAALPAAAEAKPTEAGAPAAAPAAPPAPSVTAAAPSAAPAAAPSAAPSAAAPSKPTAEPPGSDGDSAADDAGPSEEDPVVGAHPGVRPPGPAKKRHGGKRPAKPKAAAKEAVPAAAPLATTPSTEPSAPPSDLCAWDSPHPELCKKRREAASKSADDSLTSTPR